MQYFQLVKGLDLWALAPRLDSTDGDQVDVWAYRRSMPVDGPRPVPIEILRDDYKQSAEFNLGLYGVIVVSGRVGDLLRSFQPSINAQYIPADISGVEGEWEVLNLLDAVDCLDHAKSKIRYHDDSHLTKPGKPRSVERMIIDGDRAAGHELFRLVDWMGTVVASKRLKSLMESEGVTGVQYLPV
jgi:hypothetical protein